MNCCLTGNNCLWILIILLILGTCGNVFSSCIFSPSAFADGVFYKKKARA